MGRLTINLAVVIAAAIAVGAPFVADDVALAAQKTKKVSQPEGAPTCPAKVGPYVLHKINFRPAGPILDCYYNHPKRYAGGVHLVAEWWPDTDGERERCDVRDPQLESWHGNEGSWGLMSASHKVVGVVHLTGEANELVPVSKAEKKLRSLMASAESMAHRCVPEVTPTMGEGLVCPRVLPGDLVRSDYFEGSPQVVHSLGDPAKQLFELDCTYLPAFVEEGGVLSLEVVWREGDPTRGSTCVPRVDRHESVVDDRFNTTSTRLGYHPVEVEISDAFVAQGLGPRLADRLFPLAVARTQRCPSAPEGPAPYEIDGPAATTADATATEPEAGGTTETTILISGGPGEMPPAVGITIELPEDDQHDLVVGGPDGEVIREQYVGSAGEIAGYGPTVTDDEGNWTVMATVDVVAAPATPVPTTAPADPTPSPMATAEPAATAEPPPTAAPTIEPAPSSEPAPTSDPGDPSEATTPDPTPAPPTGPPDEGAIRNVQDHIEVMGEMLDDTGSAEWTIPPSDIEALVVLKPDYAKSVKLGSGSIIVDSSVGKIYVTPIIGEEGLIEVRLSTLTWLQSNDIIQGLVRALNAGVADRGGRFRTIAVTPEGITLTAEGEPH